jgi:hypothetical protein
MNRSPMKLHQAANSCREMAAECDTEEAREALLEVAASLDGEATGKEQSIRHRSRPVPMFSWTR